MSLNEIVRDFKNGDENAFSEIYKQTNRLVFYIVSRIITDADAIQDVVQDAYLSAYENIDQLIDNNFQPWINRIASNKAKDYLKKKRPLLFGDYEDSSDADYEFEIEDLNEDFQPEKVASKRETKRILNEILDDLSEEQRLCIMMFYYQEMTTNEIASDLEVNENSIKSRLRYARLKIQESVVDLEAKGVRLYGLAPIPYFIYLLRGYSEVYKVPFLWFGFRKPKHKNLATSTGIQATKVSLATKVVLTTSLVGVGALGTNIIVNNNQTIREVAKHNSLYLVEYGDKFNYDIIDQIYLGNDIEYKETYLTQEEASKVYVGAVSGTHVEFYINKTLMYFNLITVDTNKPQINGEQYFETFVGNPINYQILQSFDVIDGKLTLTYSGTVDFNKVGKYEILAESIDSNNNKTTMQITVNVKDRPIIIYKPIDNDKVEKEDEVIETPETPEKPLEPVNPENPKDDEDEGKDQFPSTGEDEEPPFGNLIMVDLDVSEYFTHQFIGKNGFGEHVYLKNYTGESYGLNEILSNVIVRVDRLLEFDQEGNPISDNKDIKELKNGDILVITYNLLEGSLDSYIEDNVQYTFKDEIKEIVVSGLDESEDENEEEKEDENEEDKEEDTEEDNESQDDESISIDDITLSEMRDELFKGVSKYGNVESSKSYKEFIQSHVNKNLKVSQINSVTITRANSHSYVVLNMEVDYVDKHGPDKLYQSVIYDGKDLSNVLFYNVRDKGIPNLDGPVNINNVILSLLNNESIDSISSETLTLVDR